MKKNIAVFSSGKGGNFENICNYFHNDKSVFVCLHVTNRIDCISKKIADKREINNVLVTKKELEKSSFCKVLIENNIQLIVLAGFLLKIPSNLVNSYERKIINLPPSLLPKFGGKGMYGDNVHLKVLESGEKKTGVTIHYVNEEYDSGDIIFQREIELSERETLETLREKIRLIEYYNYPRIIKSLL